MSWRDLFDVVVVSASKPEFFSTNRRPVYEIVTDDGMLREAQRFEKGRVYAGGNAHMVEKVMGCQGRQVLYVGDHIFTDVNTAKRGLSWRTCMIMQELEADIEGSQQGKERTNKLQRLYRQMDEQSSVLNFLQAKLDHENMAPCPATPPAATGGDGSDADIEKDATFCRSPAEMEAAVEKLRASLTVLEAEIERMQFDDGAHVNRHWGYATRAGFADKSHLMRQIEKYADIYTSRVSNFLQYTPYKTFLCGQQSLAHDRDMVFEHFRVSEGPCD